MLQQSPSIRAIEKLCACSTSVPELQQAAGSDHGIERPDPEDYCEKRVCVQNLHCGWTLPTGETDASLRTCTKDLQVPGTETCGSRAPKPKKQEKVLIGDCVVLARSNCLQQKPVFQG